MIKAAIVGLGRWGQRLVDSVHDSKLIRITHAVTRDPARARAFGDKMGMTLVDSYEAVLKSPDVDAVVLASPHSHHARQIIEAAKAGKHVFVEKPMALTAKSAAEAVKACKDAGVALGHGFGRRFAPAYLGLKDAIDSGRIGELLHLEGNFSGPSGYQLKPDFWRAKRSEAPAGGMTARGIHVLDGMISLAGPVGSVFAFSDRRKLAVELDDTTSMLLRFQSGLTGYLGCVFATANYWRIQAIGTEGWAEMRGERQLLVSDIKDNVETTDYDARDQERAILEHFAKAATKKGDFVVKPEQAVNGIAVLEAIVRSAETQQPVKLT